MYIVYTDGAYSSSNDSGGLSAVITHEGNIVKKITKGFKHTTNNRIHIKYLILMVCIQGYKIHLIS